MSEATTDEELNRYLDTGRDVARGAAVLDAVRPGWWYEHAARGVVSWKWCVVHLADALGVYAAGYRRMNTMQSRGHGFDYFFADEWAAALGHWDALIRGRLMDRRDEALAGLTALWEREPEA